jgi:hypothetical protein
MGLKILRHDPVCSVIQMPQRTGKSLAFKMLMARGGRFQAQKAMQDQIQKAKQGDTIHVQSETDAEHWSDMAHEEYGRGDLIFRAGTGKCWKAGKLYDPFAKKTTTPFKPTTTAEDRASQELKRFQRQVADMQDQIQKEQERISDLLYGRTDTAPIAAPAGSPLMKPIDVAPKDGREVMLYCPNESPSHVAAKYIKAYDKDGGGWEGWMYVDPILADIAPEGPEGATHFYEPPTPDTRLSQFTGGVVTKETIEDAMRKAVGLGREQFIPHRKIDKVFRDEIQQATTPTFTAMTGRWRDIPIENFEDDRFTIEQLVELKHRGVDPKSVQTTIRRIFSVKLNPISPISDPNAPVEKIDTSHDAICPVVNFDHAAGTRGHCTVILPDGRCERLDHIPTLL